MKYLIAFVVFGLACSVLADSFARVDEKIWENLQDAETTNVLITFKNANVKAANERIASLRLASKAARRDTQHAILKDHADVVQADVTAMLNKAASTGKKHYLGQLWISNELIVRDVDMETVEKLRSHPDVESLQAEWFIQLDDVVEEESVPLVRSNNSILLQWGVENIYSHLAWAQGYRGQGAVVGITDTGVRATHVTLRYNYRGNQPGQTHNYNWFAPTGLAPTPSDTNGHGTHVAGSACGTDGVGVAPDSYHIHCRGCATASCSNFDLLSCGNFMACPTNVGGTAPNCAMAPDVCNNSWGGGGNNPWYDGIINAWITAGVAPVFSAGNSGTAGGGCSNLLSPGDRPGAFSIGSTQANGQRSGFSSNGPTVDGRRNPLIAAPGTSIPSSSHLDDVNLRVLSGTSMAAPHISGVVALLMSRNPNLSVAQVENAIRAGGRLHAPVGVTCGGLPDGVLPNNHVGYGLVHAVNAINSV
jgi:subtilisin family serine protease